MSLSKESNLVAAYSIAATGAVAVAATMYLSVKNVRAEFQDARASSAPTSTIEKPLNLEVVAEFRTSC